MPSLHFATSVTAAHVLTDSGAAAAPLAWAYTATLGTALVYLGEHYVVDLARGPRVGRGACAGARRPARRRSARVWDGCSRRSRRGRGHERHALDRSRAEQRRLSDALEERAIDFPEPEVEEEHGLEINRRSLLGLGAFLALAIAALYFLLPQLAGLEDTWQRVEDGSPWWTFVALPVRVRDVRRLRGDVPRRSSCAPARPGSAGARATRSRWRGWPPRGSSPPAAPAGWC